MHIVSISNGWIAQIWNIVTGECEAELKPPYIYDTQLSAVGVFIQNNCFGVCLSYQLSFFNIYEDNIFHTKNLQKISIPHPFHKPVCTSHHLSKLCLGYDSGEIMVLEVCIP